MKPIEKQKRVLPLTINIERFYFPSLKEIDDGLTVNLSDILKTYRMVSKLNPETLAFDVVGYWPVIIRFMFSHYDNGSGVYVNSNKILIVNL